MAYCSLHFFLYAHHNDTEYCTLLNYYFISIVDAFMWACRIQILFGAVMLSTAKSIYCWSILLPEVVMIYWSRLLIKVHSILYILYIFLRIFFHNWHDIDRFLWCFLIVDQFPNCIIPKIFILLCCRLNVSWVLFTYPVCKW